ncbi:hypothetical protein MKEN_01382500 [Mycena kentingensis (nom. inval.)]|nr:hypothetical protein MKEN_01382500 [Mycena kentingensis (nom. inval.)]
MHANLPGDTATVLANYLLLLDSDTPSVDRKQPVYDARLDEGISVSSRVPALEPYPIRPPRSLVRLKRGGAAAGETGSAPRRVDKLKRSAELAGAIPTQSTSASSSCCAIDAWMTVCGFGDCCSTDLQCTLSNERPRSFRPTTRRRTVRDNELARTPANLNAIDDRLGLAEAHSALFDLECFGGVGAVVLSTKYEFCHYGKYRGRADGVLRGIMEYVPRVQVHETLASTEAA